MKIKVLIKRFIIKSTYAIIRHFPVKKNSYLFESHDDFTEGTFLIYKYLKDNYKKFRYVWAIEPINVNLAKKLKVKKYIYLCDYSLVNEIRTCYYHLTTERFIFSHRNIGEPVLKNNQVRLFLFHGQPFKVTTNYMNSIYNSIYIVPSEFVRNMRASIYGIEPSKMYISLNPRVLPLINGIDEKKKDMYYDSLHIKRDLSIVCCMMTWDSKEYGKDITSSLFPFSLNQEELLQLNKDLSDNEQMLVVKPHPMYKDVKQIERLKTYSNIRILLNKDFVSFGMNLYELLSISSALITDCSSVFIDYYLTEKPVIFFGIDNENNNRNIMLIDDHQKYMAGPIVNNVKELSDWLNLINSDNYPYKEKLKEQKNLWFTDNSKTVYEDIIKILDQNIN